MHESPGLGRAELETEREFLLRSLDDLDAERAAGDLGEEQHAELRARYVRRAAAVARRLEGDADGVADSEVTVTMTTARGGARPAWVLSSLAVVGLVAGVALAASLGQRSGGGSLSGTAPPQDRGAACRASVFDDPPTAVSCYDRLLRTAPDDPEFLTYRGWARVRSGDPEGAMEDFDRVVEIEPEYPDVYAFRAVVAKDRGDYVTADAELARLRALDAPATVMDTVSSMGLDVEVAEGLLRPEVLACWKRETAAITAINSVAAGGANGTDMDLAAALGELVEADKCLTAALVAQPDDRDALVMRGLAISVLYQVSAAAEPDPVVLARAFQVLDRAVELDATDPDARLVRAAVRNMSGDPQGSADDLAAIGDRAISPLFASIDVESIRADVQQQLGR